MSDATTFALSCSVTRVEYAMLVDGTPYRTIWPSATEPGCVEVIDQTRLPHELAVRRLRTLDETVDAIRTMVVRGAPLIGATAAYGLALAARRDASDDALVRAARSLLAARPTAVNLRWAVQRVLDEIETRDEAERADRAWAEAGAICEEDVTTNRAIGEHGLLVLETCAARRQDDGPLNVLTHCNAGWLATVDWGTALAPIYLAHDRGMAVHVWVDETRPRSQGALTAWELGHHGVPHTVITDNAGGHLMQRGLVDCCLVGSDRTTARGDVCNKIGTYLKALAARHCGVPFFVALPSSTIDWSIDAGADVPIEQRDPCEVTHVRGVDERDGGVRLVRVFPGDTPAANPAFDVTPAELVTGLITEHGVCAPSAVEELGTGAEGQRD